MFKKSRRKIVAVIMSVLVLLWIGTLGVIYASSYEEAAKVMKKNRKQVDNLLYRAKKELRIILGEDGEQLL